MNCGIYKIVNKTSGKFYIGSSKRISQRRYKHFYKLEKGKHKNIHLQRSFNKHGPEVFEFQVLFYCSKANLKFYEQKVLDEFWSSDDCFNIARFVDNREFSEETKQRLSESLSGREFSDEHIQNLCEANSGESNPNFGREMSKEQKEKISKAMKNNPEVGKNQKGSQNHNSKLNPVAVKVIRYCYQDKNKSYGDLSEVYNVSPMTISRIVRRKSYENVS